MEKTDLEIAKKLQEEADNEVFFFILILFYQYIAYKLQEEENRLEAERKKRLEEIERQDLEYIKKIQAEEEEKYQEEKKIEIEDSKLMEKLQKEEMKDIMKELNKWNDPKIKYGDDVDCVWISVTLPYLKKFGFNIDKDSNVL